MKQLRARVPTSAAAFYFARRDVHAAIIALDHCYEMGRRRRRDFGVRRDPNMKNSFHTDAYQPQGHNCNTRLVRGLPDLRSSPEVIAAWVYDVRITQIWL